MNKVKQSPSSNDRLGNFVLIDKQRLSKELSDFKSGVKSKEDVEIVADVFFEQMRKLNLGSR